jgi:hypothetical protein
MAFAIPERFRKLVINVGLLFIGSFAASFGAFLQATPKEALAAGVISAVAAAAIAGVRAVIGFVALQASGVPAVPVDV